MRLRRLKLKAFRNLRDVELDFAISVDEPAQPGTSREVQTHAIIGQNGSGKSNLIEALVTIFRDLDLNNSSTLDYELEYDIRGRNVSLVGARGGRAIASVDGETIAPGSFADRSKELLPAHVFAYYSGKNERIEQLFRRHEQRYSKRMELADQEVVPAHLLDSFSGEESQQEAIAAAKERRERLLRATGEDLLRRLFYCRGGHTQLVLLACFLASDPVFEQILADLDIQSLESALFVLKRPYTLRDLDESDVLDGDPRFWFARGTFVSELLDKLWNHSVAPITETVWKQTDFRGRREKQERLYLFIPDQEQLRAMGDEVGTPAHFFRYAEAAYLADLIEEVRISVKHMDSDGQVQAGQLSEGELQLLTVLGLMRITHQDECLFLLDEPDTHLNPLWKLRYFETLERVIHGEGAKGGASQILITTHDPMMVGSLRREQVHILRKTNSGTSVSLPDQDPVGMGVSGLLKSDLFGLRSTLDTTTQNSLDRRNQLWVQERKGRLSQGERTELDQLNTRLEDLGFSREYRDPLYQMFVEKLYEARKLPIDQLMLPGELAAQERLAEAITRELVRNEQTETMSLLAQELKIELEPQDA